LKKIGTLFSMKETDFSVAQGHQKLNMISIWKVGFGKTLKAPEPMAAALPWEWSRPSFSNKSIQKGSHDGQKTRLKAKPVAFGAQSKNCFAARTTETLQLDNIFVNDSNDESMTPDFF
jgi:hypothetical protein